jgi:hypothetical protein
VLPAVLLVLPAFVLAEEEGAAADAELLEFLAMWEPEDAETFAALVDREADEDSGSRAEAERDAEQETEDADE